MATAGAIAFSLVGPPPALSDTKLPAVYSTTADVELTALADSFVNPVTRWVEVLEATNSSLSTLVQTAAADPMPVLRQIIANQTAYANLIGTALSTTATGLGQWLTSEQGNGFGDTLPTALPLIIESLSQGDVLGAQAELSSTLGALATNLFGLLDLLSLPYQISANVTAALGTIVRTSLFDTGLVGRTGFGLLSTVQMGLQQLGVSGQAFVDAVEAGDPVAALSTVVNLPADFTDTVVNGYVNRFGKRIGGLLTFTPATSSGWSLGSAMLVHIPQAIAAAITPPPPAGATVGDVASLPSPAAKTLALNVGSASETADVPSVRVAAETVTADSKISDDSKTAGPATPLVRHSPIAKPGKAGFSAADNDRATPVKDVRHGIKGAAKKFGDNVKQAAKGLSAKRASSGSQTSDSGDSRSDSSE
ncbi:hypothetical protein [Mycobacterium sp. DL440]|uniref:hypothetical protein n=1 Tax=Mycobacterium sp. DL440 TaxID=2675523 RepID=UPI001423D4AB|nr:hypothetical protein [Mycobacterium sp. DL440]